MRKHIIISTILTGLLENLTYAKSYLPRQHIYQNNKRTTIDQLKYGAKAGSGITCGQIGGFIEYKMTQQG